MIKFFRHIRKRLLSESKFIKYLLYAIGEIALVMIGILLALQVNNWNEEQKERKIEKQYLKSLLEDFKKDKESLIFQIDVYKWQIQYGNDIKTLLINNEHPTDLAGFMRQCVVLGNPILFHPENPTYDDLKSSGNLKVLKNTELKNWMSSYHAFVNSANSLFYESDRKIKTDYNDHLFRYIEHEYKAYWWQKQLNQQYDTENWDIGEFDSDIKGLLSDPMTAPKINRIIGIDGEIKIWYENILNQSLDPLIELLEHEVKLQ